LLRAGNAIISAVEAPTVTETSISQNAALPDIVQNALFMDRPWFHPVESLDMPIHIDLAADAAFATRFRQALTNDSAKHIPRMNFVSDEVILSLSEAECAWPSPARARFLIKVALTTVGRCYHMVRKSAVLILLEKTLQNPSDGNRLGVAKILALFALGELYATKFAPDNALFPGLSYFSRARKMVTVPAERPQSDTLEIALLLVSYTLQGR
jgi:proline utilization trans-activator